MNKISLDIHVFLFTTVNVPTPLHIIHTLITNWPWPEHQIIFTEIIILHQADDEAVCRYKQGWSSLFVGPVHFSKEVVIDRWSEKCRSPDWFLAAVGYWAPDILYPCMNTGIIPNYGFKLLENPHLDYILVSFQCLNLIFFLTN